MESEGYALSDAETGASVAPLSQIKLWPPGGAE
jgi:hypothetical protein